MRKIGIYVLSAAASCMLLSGCGAKVSPELMYQQGRLDEMVRSLPDDQVLAEPFAGDLCVVTGGEPQSDPFVNAEAAAVLSLSDQQVIFQKNVFERMHPASITKVMTALLAVRYGDLSEEITVGDEAVITEAGASLCNIKPGDRLTLKQLLYGLMLPSGNDAGAAIAVHMAGSLEGFADMMNAEARRIGATDTHFVNPHGLTEDTHLTTAYDLYLIMKEALQYPVFREIIGTTTYPVSYTDGTGSVVTQTWQNSNRYLTGTVETPQGLHVLGGKTGTTNAAGYCLMIASEDDLGQEYVSVVLKAGNRPDLYENMTNIIRKIVK